MLRFLTVQERGHYFAELSILFCVFFLNFRFFNIVYGFVQFPIGIVRMSNCTRVNIIKRYNGTGINITGRNVFDLVAYQ